MFFVRSLYARVSTYLWWDDNGRCHEIGILGSLSPSRARDLLNAVTASIEREAEVAANLGKTRVYYAHGGPPPPGIRELGEDVWRFVALGAPIGHQEFTRSCASNRLEEDCLPACLARGSGPRAGLSCRLLGSMGGRMPVLQKRCLRGG